jgi:hypothetical protein
MRAVHDGALVPTDQADPVAGAEERVVALDDLVEESEQLGLDTLLVGRLRVLGVGDVVGTAAEDDPRIGVQVDVTERLTLQQTAHEL